MRFVLKLWFRIQPVYCVFLSSSVRLFVVVSADVLSIAVVIAAAHHVSPCFDSFNKPYVTMRNVRTQLKHTGKTGEAVE